MTFVNIGVVNDLLPDGTLQPLPAPMMTYHE